MLVEQYGRRTDVIRCGPISRPVRGFNSLLEELILRHVGEVGQVLECGFICRFRMGIFSCIVVFLLFVALLFCFWSGCRGFGNNVFPFHSFGGFVPSENVKNRIRRRRGKVKRKNVQRVLVNGLRFPIFFWAVHPLQTKRVGQCTSFGDDEMHDIDPHDTLP